MYYVVARAYSLEQQNTGGLTLGFAMHLVVVVVVVCSCKMAQF